MISAQQINADDYAEKKKVWKKKNTERDSKTFDTVEFECNQNNENARGNFWNQWYVPRQIVNKNYHWIQSAESRRQDKAKKPRLFFAKARRYFEQ